ncbi:hypothetical protein FJ444_05300 [Aestuariibacter sp. GS-14]|uniref:diacylglycerol kinase family protein n=1 Tax=Aestuariibacter sp. GS-14 TaxID=2590670 RepID=UPI00112DF9ED|nr:diacylglycerol kinase family protein [Aestuariibacter sp. GS-14]TPV61033.1 hypothetical protein FJ444_05300 [Aestuariibacter sp. GS-14]
MKMVKYYLAVSLLLIILAWQTSFWLISLLMLWCSLALFAVSTAYLSGYPGIFRKREDGRIPFYVRWLFIPFLLGVQLYNLYARKTDKVPNIQQITEHLYLGTRLTSSDIEKLRSQGITCILDVTAEFDSLDWTSYRYDVDYLNIPVLDHTSPSQVQLATAINWIEQHQLSDNKILIHCALGRGRSVFIMAAYLLASKQCETVEEAMQAIQHIRSTARLNSSQLSALIRIKQNGLLQLTKRLALIVNPVAGGGKWSKQQQTILSHLNAHFRVRIYETQKDVTAEQCAQQAVADNNDILVACGGDGTVTEVASIAIKQCKTLGIIPLGTANALSQVIYGKRSALNPIETACEVLCDQFSTTVDTARCNNKLMLLVSAIGFESKMIEHADREEKNAGGQFAYLAGLWQAIRQNEPIEVSVSYDNQPPEIINTTSLVVANAAPKTTALAQGGELPDMKDGKLDVTWLKADTDTPILSLAELAFSNTEHKAESDSIFHKRVNRINIRFPGLLRYVIDGEVYESDSLDIQTVPASLDMLVDKRRFN